MSLLRRVLLGYFIFITFPLPLAPLPPISISLPRLSYLFLSHSTTCSIKTVLLVCIWICFIISSSYFISAFITVLLRIAFSCCFWCDLHVCFCVVGSFRTSFKTFFLVAFFRYMADCRILYFDELGNFYIINGTWEGLKQTHHWQSKWK